MKDGDYINILAPMKSKLKLKGNALMLFALIHGYSKDGKNTCRVSLSYMAEWLDTDKSAASKLINKLAKAGYINKLEYYSGGVKCFEYTANYEAMLVKAMRGEAMGLESPSVKGGCQNDNGCQNDQKGLSKRPKRVVKMTTNNKDIIIYNNYSCAEPAQQEKEKKDFYKIFFFRFAADPAVEVQRFISYNESLQWRNEAGREYNTPAQRQGLAGLWKIQEVQPGTRLTYLKAVKALYDEAVSMGIEGAEVMVNHAIDLVWNGRISKWVWMITREAQEWLSSSKEAHDLAHKHLDPMLKGFKAEFRLIQAS